MQLEVAISKCHYVVVPYKRACLTLKDKKNKVMNTIILCFLYMTKFFNT